MNRLLTTALLVAGIATPAAAQSLGIGDPAPKLDIAHWLKGDPVDLAEGRGKKVYVVEFWATWCPPCIQSIPHMTELQKRYQKDVVVVSITDEPKRAVKPFMRKMGDKMGYTVACDRDQRTSRSYMVASGQMGIPTVFIVDRQGRIAWVGNPFQLDGVLKEVVAGTYDVERAKAAAIADNKFFATQQMDLMMAMHNADWERCLKIGREVADPANPISQGLRMQVLNAVSWAMLTDQRADKKYFQEALHLAKAAYDVCGCDDPSVIDTYARALFDNGHLHDAVEQQKKAVAIAEGQMKAELQRSLKRYEQATR